MTFDPYLDLDHGVLKNRLGITDLDELREAEGAATALRMSQLIRRPLPGGYDLAHLQAFHWHLFSDVFQWSGQLRTVTIGRGHLFCPPEQIQTTGRDIFSRLEHADYLRGLQQRDAFVDELTRYLSLKSTHYTRSATGTVEVNGSSFVSSRGTPAGC